MPRPLNEIVRDYDDTLAGQLIRATENPDSIGFINDRWYSPKEDSRYRSGRYDPNGYGFGIDKNKNEYITNGTYKPHLDSQGRPYMTIEEERSLRNHTIANLEDSYKDRLAYAQSVIGNTNVPSETKKALTLSAMYNMGQGYVANNLFEDRDLMNAFLNGSDMEYSNHVNRYFTKKGIPSRGVNTNKFLLKRALLDTPRTSSKPIVTRDNSQTLQIESVPVKRHQYRTAYTPTPMSGTRISNFVQGLKNKYGLKAEGGSLNNSTWDSLSLKEKNDVIKVAIKNGLTTIPEIKAKYNELFTTSDNAAILEEPNMYPNGGYKPSSSIKKRISNWEGKAMIEYTYDPNLGRVVAPNASFDTVARDFVNVIPRSIRSQVLGNQNLADYLYSYAYNVGPGNFKKRVVPALMNYYQGKGSAEDVAESMWATGDRKKNLSGLRKRRAVERNGVRMALGLKPKQYTNADFGLRSNTKIPIVIPSQEELGAVYPAFVPSNPQAFFNPELLNSQQVEVKLDNPLVDNVEAYAEELQRQEALEKRQNANNLLGMLLGGSGLGASPFTALANSDSPLVSLASMMQGSSNENSNPFDYTANLFASGGPTIPPSSDNRYYYDYELPENGGDNGILGYIPRDAKFAPNKGVWFKETGPNEVTTWEAYQGNLPEATVVGHRKGILPELVTPVDNTKITAPLRPNEVKNPEFANLTREGNRQHAQWAKEHPYLDIAGGVAPLLPAAVVSAPYIASSLSTLPTLGTAVKSAASNPYTWRRLGTSLIGGLAVDKASKLATGKSWGENAARGVDYLTGWDLQNSDLGRTIMDFTNPGYFAGGVGFINRGLDNIERRAFETAMRTSSRPDGLQSTLTGVKNLVHSSDGRRRLGRIGNYILTGKKGKVFGDYNSFSASDPYTGFFEYEGAPNLTGRKDYIDAFLYGDTIDPAFGVKKIAEGENFGIHAPYIAEHYAGKASKIPVYEVDTPGGLHNLDVLPLRTVGKEGSFATPSKYAVDAQGHIGQIGIDQNDLLSDPVTMGQDIWKFNSDYFNRYFKRQNLNPFKNTIIKAGLKELDRLSTPIITRTKWVPIRQGYTPEDISSHTEFLNASLEPKTLTGIYKLKNKKPPLPITDYKTLQGGIILQ